MIKILELDVLNGLKIKVHDNGIIETLDHTSLRKNGRADNRRGKTLKQKIDKYGYLQITLTNDGIRKSFAVHRLVAMAYIQNTDAKETVNHIDGKKVNNHVSNLEWATQKEQKTHSIKTGLAALNVQSLADSNKRKSIPVKFRGSHYPSIKAASREHKVHERVVRAKGEVMHYE